MKYLFLILFVLFLACNTGLEPEDNYSNIDLYILGNNTICMYSNYYELSLSILMETNELKQYSDSVILYEVKRDIAHNINAFINNYNSQEPLIKWPFNKKYKCKGHTIIKDNNCTMLILENEERVFVPNKYIIEFDDGWFKLELQKVKQESQGKAVVNHNLK